MANNGGYWANKYFFSPSLLHTSLPSLLSADKHTQNKLKWLLDCTHQIEIMILNKDWYPDLWIWSEYNFSHLTFFPFPDKTDKPTKSIHRSKYSGSSGLHPGFCFREEEVEETEEALKALDWCRNFIFLREIFISIFSAVTALRRQISQYNTLTDEHE